MVESLTVYNYMYYKLIGANINQLMDKTDFMLLLGSDIQLCF